MQAVRDNGELLGRIKFIMRDLGVSRPTATKYLQLLVDNGLLGKIKISKDNFYTNDQLFTLLINAFHLDIANNTVSIDSQG